MTNAPLPPLVIEYVMEGQQRGYNFTSPTHGYSEALLRYIWRSAMPRGQGWGAYIGAESLKTLALPEGRMALAHMTVTDQQDEIGRRGIRRTVITVFAQVEYPRVLNTLFTALPASIQQDADHHLREWARGRTLERLANPIKRARQLLFAHTYTTMADWRVVEAVMFRLALLTHPPRALHPLGKPLLLTTLALQHTEESPLLSMPAEKTAAIHNVPKLTII
jgi:hypothetical protein